jgi:hypothetical protein
VIYVVNKKQDLVLWIVGAILIIAGICIVVIHNPLRGSGLGTLCMAAGVILVVVGIVRQSKK